MKQQTPLPTPSSVSAKNAKANAETKARINELLAILKIIDPAKQQAELRAHMKKHAAYYAGQTQGSNATSKMLSPETEERVAATKVALTAAGVKPGSKSFLAAVGRVYQGKR